MSVTTGPSGGQGQGGSATTVTTTISIITTTTGPGGTSPPTLPPSTTTTALPTPTTTTTTTAPPTQLPADLPPILTAGPNGIGYLGGDLILGPIPDDEPGEWVYAVDDGAGGLVYAAVGADVQTIWWWGEGREPEVISFKPWRALHDAAVVGGRPVAIVEDNPDPSPDVEPEIYVQLVDLATLEEDTVPRQVGGIEWGISQVDHAGGRFLVTEVNHSCGEVYAFDASGADVDLPGVPAPACQIHFEVPYAGAAYAPDGSSFVVLERHTEDTGEPGGRVAGTDLVLYRGGAEALRVPVAGPDVDLSGVDFDGRWAIVPGPFDAPAEQGGDPIVVDTQAADPAPISLAGNGAYSYRFLTVPLAVGFR